MNYVDQPKSGVLPFDILSYSRSGALLWLAIRHKVFSTYAKQAGFRMVLLTLKPHRDSSVAFVNSMHRCWSENTTINGGIIHFVVDCELNPLWLGKMGLKVQVFISKIAVFWREIAGEDGVIFFKIVRWYKQKTYERL